MLEAIRLYPVKSLGGVDVETAEVQPWGLRHDQRWLVMDSEGTVLTARDEHSMLGLTATPFDDCGIELSARDGATFRVEPPLDGEILPTSLSRLENVVSAGSDADRWMSTQLGRPVRLGWLDDPRRRTVSAAHGGLPGDHLNLADAGPLLLTTLASLRQLNAWIAKAALERGETPARMEMNRFRPGVVVDCGDEPFAEDRWTTLRIGDVPFRLSEPCDRCVVTTIDPYTFIGGKEPLRTLARYRQWDHKTWFGIRLVPTSTGIIRVGDPVDAESRAS